MFPQAMGKPVVTLLRKLKVILSEEDVDKVMQHSWGMWGPYPYCKKLGLKLHQYIMGPRPTDLPDNYIIDHINRVKVDASRENLRWVSPSFNAWNVITASRTGYLGVRWMSQMDKWRVTFRGRHVGYFEDARDGFVHYATEAVREWPLWAPTSDLLVGPGLLSHEEMCIIQATMTPSTDQGVRVLPRGVDQIFNGSYQARLHSKYLGLFSTVEEAYGAYCQAKDMYDKALWDKHYQKAIPRDDKGNAVIHLTGKRGQGLMTFVPEELYHVLTFQRSWWLKDGYPVAKWSGQSVALHIMVYRLLHPTYIAVNGGSIDHINHDEFDNTAANLRPANQSLQNRNKRKKLGASSQYVGVSKRQNNSWTAKFAYHGTVFHVGTFATEEQAAHALKKQKIEIIPDEIV